LAILGFDLGALHLLSIHSIIPSHIPSPFYFRLFFRSCVFCPVSSLRPQSFSLGLFHSWDHRHMPGLLVDMILLTFCPGWPQSVIFQLSISRVAGITGRSHHAKPLFSSLFFFVFQIF
jgi:hypothetical protein